MKPTNPTAIPNARAPEAVARTLAPRIGSEIAPAFTSNVTGSWLGDAVLGGLVGAVFAPAEDRLGSSAVGAVATGLAGALGLAITGGYLWYEHARKK